MRLRTTALVLIALLCLVPLARAQDSHAGVSGPILQSALRIADDVAAHAPQNAAAALPTEPKETWLRFAEGAYVTGMLADFGTTYVALRQRDVNGNPVNKEANPLLPDSSSGILAVKVGAIVGGILAAEKLWAEDHKWQAIAALAGGAAITFAAACNNVYQIQRTGTFPAPGTTAARRR